MSYDLRRLVRKGIICRVAGSQRWYLTPYGWRLARFYARAWRREYFRLALTALIRRFPVAKLPEKPGSFV